MNESTKISTHQTISRDINKDTDNVQMAMPTSEEKYKSDEGLKMKFSGGFLNKKRPNPSIAVQLKPAQVVNEYIYTYYTPVYIIINKGKQYKEIQNRIWKNIGGSSIRK